MSDLFTETHYAAWDGGGDDTAEVWTVHISGPDDVLPAKDYADAVRQANEINASYEKAVPTLTEYHPRMWATPCPKGRYAYPLTRDEMR